MSWFNSYHREWLEQHPEFKSGGGKEIQEVCMAYLRKILKEGPTRALPYDKSIRYSEQKAEEDKLLSELPPLRFDDLEDKEEWKEVT